MLERRSPPKPVDLPPAAGRCRRELLLLFLLAESACAPVSRTTLTVHDPERVSVDCETAQPPPSRLAGDPIPARGEDVVLDRGELPTSADTRSSYELRAVRRADGRVDLLWNTPMALSTGNTQTLPGRDEVGVREVPAASILGGEAYVRHPCARIAQVFTASGSGRFRTAHFAGFGPSLEWHPCTDGARKAFGVAVPLTVSTPWSNVTIREKTSEHDTLRGALLVSGFLGEAAILVGLPLLIDGLAERNGGRARAGGILFGSGTIVEATRILLSVTIPFSTERTITP